MTATKNKDWKLFIVEKHFSKTFGPFPTVASKNLFIGSLLCCGTNATRIKATGTDDGYCISVTLLEDEIMKNVIDDVLGSIDDYYTEALELG
jgi:hypothetical protein